MLSFANSVEENVPAQRDRQARAIERKANAVHPGDPAKGGSGKHFLDEHRASESELAVRSAWPSR